MDTMSLDERSIFLLGLATLFVSGCVVLGINVFTDSRKAQLSTNIVESMWGFTPDVARETQLRRQKWAYRKLIAAGTMMCALLLSTTVRALRPALALAVSGGLWSVWCLGVTAFWYSSVVPGSTTPPIESSVAPGSTTPPIESSVAPGPASAPLRLKEDEDPRLPVTLVTGFLGSGKTTLVKHILSNTVGMKVLVIENEVGEEGIDHDLLLQYAGKEEIVLLKNGCVCCTVRSDLIQTFRSIFEKKSILSALDWVVIETTGLADPAPVIQSLLVDEECKKYLRLDSVLTIVDSKHITMHLPIPGGETVDSPAIPTRKNASEAAMQIAFADRVLLNKRDLVTTGELEQVKALVSSVNPEAEVITCCNSEVDLNQILNIRTFDPNEFTKSFSIDQRSATLKASGGYSFLPKDETGKVDLNKRGFNFMGRESSGRQRGMLNVPARLGKGHETKDVVSTLSLSLPDTEPLDLDKVNEWLLAVLQRDGVDIYRFKGILNIAGYDEKFILHGVHMIFNGERGKKWEEGQTRQSKLVFIGKNLNADELHSHFLNCRVSVNQQGNTGVIRDEKKKDK